MSFTKEIYINVSIGSTRIAILENNLGIVAEKVMLPLQDGDVPDTYADITDLQKDLKYEPKISVEQGIKKFVDWYKEYYEQ